MSLKLLSIGKDAIIRNLLKAYNIKYSILIYDLITYSPIENIIGLVCGKFGVSKMVALIIIAFII